MNRREATPAAPGAASKVWVAMFIENEPYPADVRVRSEAETLSAAGYRVTVVAPRQAGQANTERIGDVEVRRFWLPGTSASTFGFLCEYAVAHLQLARHALVLLARGVQILHVNNPPDTLVVLLLLGRLLRRRTVFDNHDLFPELFEVRFGKRRFISALRFFQRLAFRSADLVLTTNESQRDLVLEAVQRPAESVMVVRNGPREALTGQRVTGRGLVIDQNAPLQLLFLGALGPQDGVVVLAEVLELLVNKYALSAQLTVVGDGSCRGELAAESRRRGVGELLTFTGRIPHEDVASWLQRAHICLDPAPCNDLNHASTMIKIAEYMAAAKPIVAFDLRETRRTAGGGAVYARCGSVEDFAFRTAELARRPHLAEAVVRKAQERLPQLVWERSAAVLVDSYARLWAAAGPLQAECQAGLGP